MDITPETLFNASRRDILKIIGLLPFLAPSLITAAEEKPEVTPESYAVSYNNFYEFSYSKSEPAKFEKRFNTDGWLVEVTGAVKKPLTFSIKALSENFDMRERLYRLRCVEAFSMNIPWRGFELSRLILMAEPKPSAKFVAFEACADPAQMPNVAKKGFPFPYVEGLRLDEAMHPLTILATGAYSKPLLPQNGAPVRLVVPWKYGFKSIKSVVKIILTEKQPPTTWNSYLAKEYGFYSNVNPNVPHPRWQQSSERFFGKDGVRVQTTLLFNGYNVADIYEGLDLKKNY
jgi:sulfoxide reductase catalytic subunit YedY